jgi:hypothetical protein
VLARGYKKRPKKRIHLPHPNSCAIIAVAKAGLIDTLS